MTFLKVYLFDFSEVLSRHSKLAITVTGAIGALDIKDFLMTLKNAS
jgi:hypothetical protein